MEIIHNPKEFKVIKLSFNDRINLGWGDICMHCNEDYSNPMYFVAALNDILCKKCYKEWYENAINYPEDRNLEEAIFRDTLDRLIAISMSEYSEEYI